MEIIQWTPEYLTPVTQFYNCLTAAVPHCYPVNETDFAEGIPISTGQSNDLGDNLESQMVFVGMHKNVFQGFIHVGYYQDKNEKNEKVNTGVIRFLGYRRGARHAGQKLLEKAESYLKQHSIYRIIAFSKLYRYRFYHFEYAHLSDALDHVQALLKYNGYQPYNGQVFMDWDNFTVKPTTTNLPITTQIDWRDGRGKLPNCNISAYIDGEEVGVCWSVSCGEFSNHPDVQDWVYTDWLGIEDDYQGKGLGKYLLQYSLQEMSKVGYRHAALSTSWDNHLAMLFYSNCGYRVVDWTYAYDKTISEKAIH